VPLNGRFQVGQATEPLLPLPSGCDQCDGTWEALANQKKLGNNSLARPFASKSAKSTLNDALGLYRDRGGLPLGNLRRTR
jgi:hypothetical protein